MKKIKIYLNSSEKEIEKGSSLQDVIKTLNMKSPMFVAELNMEIIPKERHDSCLLKDGDRLEIVSFFGGG